MRADELTSYAVDHGLLSTSGRTPASTMRARLSDNLRKLGFQSDFQRVGPNRFALREWGLLEYIAPRFKKDIPNEILACIPASSGVYRECDFGFMADHRPLTNFISDPKNIEYVNRPEAEERIDIRQLVAYVVLRNEIGEVLTYRRGVYSAAHQMLRGARCLGFGGHVQEDDAYSLLGWLDGGVLMASMREIAEELGGVLPVELAVRGAINDCSSPEGMKHIALVLEGLLPPGNMEEKAGRERSINDLQFMSPNEVWSRFHEFEFWSQLVTNQFWPAHQPKNRAAIRPLRKNLQADTFMLVGEIASGKTTFGRCIT